VGRELKHKPTVSHVPTGVASWIVEMRKVMDTPAVHERNADQAAYWNGPAGAACGGVFVFLGSATGRAQAGPLPRLTRTRSVT
jgi:hypothetical protein